MGKAAFGAVAAACATAGVGYEVTRAFVPAAQAPGFSDGSVSLRGASQATAIEAPTLGGSSALLVLAGASGVAAVGSSRPRAARRAEAVATMAAGEEPAPPPPFDPAKQLGVTFPLGFFDPLGFSKVGDEEGFRNLRNAELKHGRVAMMAAVGAVAQSLFQFPGFDKVPKGMFALTSEQGLYGFVALFVVSGALELTIWKDDPGKGVESIGDYGNPLQLGIGSPLGESEDMKNRELNNGRAAMFAAVGIIAAELATGKNAVEQLL